jgi:hypothetical protein
MYKTKRFIDNKVLIKEFRKGIKMTYAPTQFLGSNCEISLHIEVDENNACKKIWFGLKCMKLYKIKG